MLQIKKIIAITAIIMLLMGLNVFAFKHIMTLKKENNRISNNFLVSSQKVDSVYNEELNTYVYQIQSMQLTNDEIVQQDKDLAKTVEAMGIKVKNLNNVIDTKLSIIANLKKQVNYDEPGIVTKQINDTLFMATYKDSSIQLSENISLKKLELLTGEIQYKVEVENLQLKLEPKLKFIEDITYKGIWFWRKVEKMNLHVISDNKYVKIDELKEYNLVSKKKSKAIGKQK